jgi:peptidoglycan-associated lipoprotein
MRMKILTTIAAMALLAACSTASDTAGTASGSAGSSTTNGTASSAAAGQRVVLGTQEDLKQNVGDRIFFATDQSTVTSEGRTILERQAEWLKRYPALTVTIEGNCDERGLREYNLALGDRRAATTRQVLVALGIDPGRVSTISYGKERPAIIGSDESAWAQNRRSVTVIN